MSNDQPPPGQPPEDDPFLKKPPPSEEPGSTPHTPGGTPREPGGTPPEPPHEPPHGPPPMGSPYGGASGPPPASPHDPNADRGSPYGGSPYGGSPHGDSPYGGSPYGGTDPLAGMPPLAPFGKRLLARIIDVLIIFIPLAIISAFTGGAWGSTNGNGEWDNVTNQVNTGRHWIWSLISIVAYVGYDTYMTKKYGQTLGKRWMKIRVALLNNGALPDTNSSLLRAAVLWLPALICCFILWWIIILVTVLVSRPYRQGLHDKAARTVVVSATQ
ncbi:RDD family protein [Streptomyces sp. NPDC012623]|uniref:RDD family protein n=1 Tax=unclassified Streptomyces TaxID=2593676 RepID=UPI00369FCB98